MKLATIFLAFALAASASTIINLNNPAGNLGATETYTQGSVSITAYGFSLPLIPTDLWGKNDGGDENGLGLRFFPDHEISGLGFVQFDVLGLQGLKFSFNSTTDGELWKVYESNVLGLPGALILSGSDEGVLHAVSSTKRYLSVLGGGGGGQDVLVKAISVEAVPEPGTVGMLGIGLVAMAWRVRRCAS